MHDNLTAGAGLAAGFAKWSPESGEPISQRLGTIVGSAMGYEPEDLPWEVPLIELGLDSLMAVRIKNRVEYDFDLPPIQLTAVRDANLYAVEKLIEYAIEHRDEVEQLAEVQKTQTDEEIAAAQAELMGGATTVAELEEMLAQKAAEEPEAAASEAVPSETPPPPTNPRVRRPDGSGPARPERGGRRGCGAQPAGRRRRTQLRRAAARCVRAGRVRDVGDRHGQVAGWHLQPASTLVRRGRAEDGATRSRSAPRDRSRSTT